MPESAAKPKPSSSSKRSSGGSRAASFAPSPKGIRARARRLGTSRSFAAAEAVTLTALVSYDLLGASEKKLPRPAPIVAALAFYALLAAFSSIARSTQQIGVALAWLLTLSVLVTGRRGKGIVRMLSDLAGYVGRLGGDSQAPAQTGGAG